MNEHPPARIKRQLLQAPPLLLLFLLLLSLLSLSGCDRQSKGDKKHFTIGILNLNPQLDPVIKSFKKGLEEWGYREGENCTILYDGASKNAAQLDGKLKELLEAKVDLLYTLTTPATIKAKMATRDTNIPILFGPLYSPVESGIVESLVKPGGNITGIKIRGGTNKALEWLLTVSPSIRTIFVPFHHTDEAAIQSLEDLKEAAALLGVRLITEEITSKQDLLTAMAHIPEETDAVWVTHSHLIVSNVDVIVRFARAKKLPIGSTTALRSGVLVSYSSDLDKLGKQASRMADKLLQGISAADLPVETAEYFLGINLQTARAIDLHISDDILSQADIIVR